MVDRPPFVDPHSLLNKVTLKRRPEVKLAPFSRPPCEVVAVLGKEESFVSLDITGILNNLQH